MDHFSNVLDKWLVEDIDTEDFIHAIWRGFPPGTLPRTDTTKANLYLWRRGIELDPDPVQDEYIDLIVYLRETRSILHWASIAPYVSAYVHAILIIFHVRDGGHCRLGYFNDEYAFEIARHIGKDFKIHNVQQLLTPTHIDLLTRILKARGRSTLWKRKYSLQEFCDHATRAQWMQLCALVRPGLKFHDITVPVYCANILVPEYADYRDIEQSKCAQEYIGARIIQRLFALIVLVGNDYLAISPPMSQGARGGVPHLEAWFKALSMARDTESQGRLHTLAAATRFFTIVTRLPLDLQWHVLKKYTLGNTFYRRGLEIHTHRQKLRNGAIRWALGA
jgi:hypothetical protein